MDSKKLKDSNPCNNCIDFTENECCKHVYIVLNPDELYLFEDYRGLYLTKGGGIFYHEIKCPYLNSQLMCKIHDKKPLYCKYYPIFITGNIFLDDNCPIHLSSEYQLTENIKSEIQQLQKKYPIYQNEWFWDDIKKLLEESA